MNLILQVKIKFVAFAVIVLFMRKVGQFLTHPIRNTLAAEGVHKLVNFTITLETVNKKSEIIQRYRLTY